MSPARFNGVPLTRWPWGVVRWCGEGEDPRPDRCGGGGGGVYRAAAQFWRGRYTADDGPAAVAYTRSSSRGIRVSTLSSQIY